MSSSSARRLAVVTGAYGYLGGLVRARLDNAGWATAAMVRTPRAGDRASDWSLGAPAPYELLHEADALIHCAYDFTARGREEIWRVNVAGSSALLLEAKRAGVARVITFSSMSAYSGTTQLYGQAKLEVEKVAVDLGGIAVRPGLVYGPTPAGMAGALLKLARLPLVPVLGGSARQFPVHEDDLARVIVQTLDSADWTPDVFGIAQPNAVSFRELLSALAATDGRTCRFLPVPWRGVYAALRLGELIGAPLPLRSDSMLGLVRPATRVPRSRAFPDLLETLRTIGPTTTS